MRILKTLLFSVISVFALSSLALADMPPSGTVVNLVSQLCTPTAICFNVQNDGGISVDYISYAVNTSRGRLVISINGDIYDSGLYAFPNPLAATIYDASGNSITASLVVTEVTGPCVREGKVTVCPTTVTLQSGTITFN